MHLPILTKQSCIPKDKDPCHIPTIVAEKHKIALLGFIELGLNDQEYHDFPEDFLREWENHVSLSTSGDYVGSTLPLSGELLAHNSTITETTTWET